MFDFLKYLTQIDPASSYVVTPLTGGIVNFTVRASKETSGDAASGVFATETSVILKYAPPYVAGEGEKVPMSQYRQTVEARALSLFLPQADLLHEICVDSSVAVPTLLLHDRTYQVLVLSDLGKWPNLSDLFSELGGYIPSVVPLKSSLHLGSSQSRSYYTTIGSKIGTFFALLHSPTTLAQILNSPSRGRHYFDNPGTKEAVLQYAIKPIASLLASFPSILDASRAQYLYQHIEADWLREPSADELVLAFGDCWPGGILASPNPQDPSVGVIDWEFAGLGRGVDGDMSQLLAHFHLFHLAAQWHEDEASMSELQILASSISRAYRRQSMAAGAPWTISRPDSRLKAQMMRSVLLVHGVEMVNCAFWKVWRCDDKRCGTPHPSEKKECWLIQRMVQRAVGCFNMAVDEDKDFDQVESWLGNYFDFIFDLNLFIDLTCFVDSIRFHKF